jgi:hypothetical protein
MKFNYSSGRFGLYAEKEKCIFLSNGPIFILDNAEKKYFLVRTPITKYIHFGFAVESSKSSEARLYKEPTITTTGTVEDIECNNDNYSTAPQTLIYSDPTYSDIGNNELTAVIGSDDPSVVGALGGSYEMKRPRILKQNSDYIVEFESMGNDNRFSHIFYFIEEG